MSGNDHEIENITCPFCGLACDDLRIGVSGGQLDVKANGCVISRPAYAAASRDQSSTPPPRVQGRSATLDEALARAASILGSARGPLISGMATDVAGARAVMDLADRVGAVTDHMGSTAKLRNLLVVQDCGWITTTLTEVRNRADLIVFVGTDAVSRFPRFFERIVWVRESMFDLDPAAREIVYLGEAADTSAGTSPTGRAPTVIPCENRRLGEVLGGLRALANGRRPQTWEVAGVPIATLEALAEKMKQSKYGVAVWAAGDLNYPHAELTVETLADLIRDLNRAGRFNGVALAGTDGDFTFNQVHTWQTGYPFRTSLGSGHPVYDPYHNATERLLESGEADVLLWVSSLSVKRTPPATSVPTIVIGHAAMVLVSEPEVFIPVATPGVDATGHFYRADKVVALPLRKLRDSGLPGVADVVGALLARLG